MTCVEIGGSSVETVTFAPDATIVRTDGAHRSPGSRLGIASPGLIAGSRVVAASSLGWFDIDPAIELGIGPPAEVVLNDAEAAALGEVALRDGVTDAVYICLGTGVGAAVVIDGAVVAANLLGHATAYSHQTCLCGQVGCLETIAAGWALPEALSSKDVQVAARAVADALAREPAATPPLVVLGGGLVRKYPAFADAIASAAPGRVVETSAAPHGFKSAAAWGVRAAMLGKKEDARISR